jgi:hypothetical protein
MKLISAKKLEVPNINLHTTEGKVLGTWTFLVQVESDRLGQPQYLVNIAEYVVEGPVYCGEVNGWNITQVAKLELEGKRGLQFRYKTIRPSKTLKWFLEKKLFKIIGEERGGIAYPPREEGRTCRCGNPEIESVCLECGEHICSWCSRMEPVHLETICPGCGAYSSYS